MDNDAFASLLIVLALAIAVGASLSGCAHYSAATDAVFLYH